MNSQKKAILWLSFTILDKSLHKTALLNVLDQFSKMGYNVSLIAMRSKRIVQTNNSKVRMFSFPLRYVPFFSLIMFTVMLFFLLPIYIIRLKPNYIIIDPNFHVIGAFPGLLVSKFKKVKLVLDIRTTPVETKGFQGSMRKFWFSVSILISKKLFNGITIITPMMKKELCCSFNLNPHKVGVWTSGVSIDLFNPQNFTSQSGKLKKKLGLCGKFVIFYHGILTATRGLKETIQAIEILKHKYPDIVLFLLGSGPEVPFLNNFIVQKNLRDNVIIHSPVDQSVVPAFISVCDVGIVPLPHNRYWRFQSPLKLLEYLSMEKVIILSDIPAHRMIIDRANCGVFTSVDTPIRIAEAIEFVYCNKKALKEWGKLGREIVKKEYTWQKVSKDLENYLLSIK